MDSSWAISNPKRWCCSSVALHMSANLENSTVATGLEKASFHSNPKERQCQRCSNYSTIAPISHASKEGLCPKSFKLDFSRTWTKNFQMCKLDWKKAEEVEIKLPTILGSRRRQKTATSASLTMLKHLTVWITINCGKSLKKSEYQTTLPASWETGRRVKNQHLEPYMEKLTGSKLGKE